MPMRQHKMFSHRMAIEDAERIERLRRALTAPDATIPLSAAEIVRRAVRFYEAANLPAPAAADQAILD